eukprot:2406493-Prymnesium_polylepis.1
MADMLLTAQAKMVLESNWMRRSAGLLAVRGCSWVTSTAHSAHIGAVGLSGSNSYGQASEGS